MRAALAPVEALKAERRPGGLESREVDAELGDERGTCAGERQHAAAVTDETAIEQTLEDANAEIAREMVVADPRSTQRDLRGPCPHAHRLISDDETHHRLEQPRDLITRERVVAVPALLSQPEQPTLLELREVRARGLRR